MGDLTKSLNALYGAYRLARFDAKALRYFDPTVPGFWHSFQAAIWVFPLYMAIVFVRWMNLDMEIAGLRFFLIEVIAYVIAWVAFPNILLYVVRALDRENKYYRAVIAYNWAAVIQNLVYTPVAIINLSGVSGAGPLTFMVLIAILIYTWYVTKTSLDLRGSTAWLVVGVDILISMVLSFWVDALLSSG
jgi:hypothetical protein